MYDHICLMASAREISDWPRKPARVGETFKDFIIPPEEFVCLFGAAFDFWPETAALGGFSLLLEETAGVEE